MKKTARQTRGEPAGLEVTPRVCRGRRGVTNLTRPRMGVKHCGSE